MPVGEVCDETGSPQSEALWGEKAEQRNERTATNRSGEGYEACDDDEQTKAGGNASVAKAWQERLSQSGKNWAIAKRRILYSYMWIAILNRVTLFGCDIM